MSSGSFVHPAVSVLMPVFNAARSISATLNSLSAQHFTNWELVAFDDGSSDHSVDLISSWARTHEQSVQILRGPNSGPSAARNRAAEAASGEFLAFLDADDLWHPDKLLFQVRALDEHPEWSGVGCDYQIRLAESGQLVSTVHFNWSTVSVQAWSFLEARGPALCSTLLVRSSAFQRVGGFNARLKNLEDVDLALKLASSDSIGNVHVPLCDYLMSGGQNHRDMNTVRHAVLELSTSHPVLSVPRNRRRLIANLELLQAKTEWLSGKHLSALGRAFRTFVRSPVCVIRTIIKRLRWNQHGMV